MDQPLIEFSPRTGTAAEWNDAYARLADYLRAYRIHSRLHRTYLILETLRRAKVTHEKHPDQSPTAVVIHEARRMHRAWLRGIIGDLNVPEGRLDANGRLAFLLCDGPTEYPDFFLNSTEAPLEMLQAMRRPIQQSGPDLMVSSMVPRPIDLGALPDIAEETSGFFGRHPWLRYALLAAFAALVGWSLWEVTH
ncbi:MAG: hypothetical protein EOP86_24635 [Verrucomicrobiaceae bacterium]|nr:MAG: hypothetical protein EOP86_24635 [Verrucomicrobiaceae bacterium]